ncbi:MAG: hypothetical protein IJ313_09850 [Clostridia bacterium]|nr:hypothetical protein [Clostridia bacterium]
MEYKNHYTKRSQILFYSGALFFLGIGIVCSTILFSLLFSVRELTILDLLIIFLFLLLCDFFCFGFAYYGIAFVNMRFQVSQSGIGIKYPCMRWRFISWDCVQQVCICNAVSQSKYGERRGFPVICIVKKGEVEGLHGRWKMYNLFHLYGVITIDYTDSFLSLIAGNCPHSLIDLRHKAAYRLSK